MQKHLLASIAILSLFISACGAQPTEASVSVDDIQRTSEAIAFTIVAESQAAIPTDTATEASTLTPLPTDTLIPSATLDASLVTASAATHVASVATADPCNQPLLSWQGDSASLDIYYDYTPQSKDDTVVVSLWVMTDLGECGFLYDLSTGPIGQYTARAFVNGKTNFKVSGGFRISPGSWKLIIRNNSIVAQGGCYPNC
jgi:hypothetical protein